MKLNFNEVKRPTLEIVLNDKDQTQITLTTPTKADKELFINLFENISSQDKKPSMADVWVCCANLLSYNLENKKITPDFVESIFTIDDVIILFKTYQEFLYGIYQLKN